MPTIICGFPGVGKSTLKAKFNELWTPIHDSDSSQFSWISKGVRHPEWPRNYLEHIQSLKGIVLVSTHREVRQALRDAGMAYSVVFPAPHVDRDTYVRERIVGRGSPKALVDIIHANWTEWLADLATDKGGGSRYQLDTHQFLADIPFSWFANAPKVPTKDIYADTPRTKAALIKKQTNDGIWEAVHATFAQQLERELISLASLNPMKPIPCDPEEVGKLVREIWIKWAREQPVIKPSWTQPWEALSEPDREVDRRIGFELFRMGYLAGRASRQARIDSHEAYIKKLDGLIEEVGGITVSCINPYEDLKRALIALKTRANEAEAKVAHMVQAGNKTGAEFVGQVDQLNRQLLAAESMEVQIRALANAFTLGTLTNRKVTMAIQAADAFASRRFGSDKGELSADEALNILGVENGLPNWRQRYQALLQILFRWMQAHQGTAEDLAQQTDKLLTLVRALTLYSRSDRSFLEIINDLFAKQDTRRIDQLQKLVLYKPSVGENKEAVVVFPNNERLETALLEQEGDLRKALDQIVSK